MAKKKNILLIISGSVAAYKALDLVRLLKAQNLNVKSILTKGGAEFITPLAVSSLSGSETFTDLFSLKDEVDMGHIQLAREADMILVVPASADLIAKMAHGDANDLATTCLLANAYDKPVLVAPAMNHKMWSHPATQRNVAQLKQDGAIIMDPEVGKMACNETGKGRMVSPEVIIPTVLQQLAMHQGPLAGKRALVTAGPTHELIDPVRYIGNRSSGKQGYAIAEALEAAGAEVLIVSGPTGLEDPDTTKIIRVRTAEEMYQASIAALPTDIAIFAAAVADWRPDNRSDQKLKKSNLSGGTPEITLVETSDILATVAQHEHKRPELVIGFAAETENLLEHGEDKLRRKGCDWLLANNTAGGRIFGEEDTELLFIEEGGHEKWGAMDKKEAADILVQKIIGWYADKSGDDDTSNIRIAK